MKTKDYIERAMEKAGCETNADFARKLGVERSAITRYREGERTMDDYTAAQVAEILGMPPIMLIAQANAEREKDITRKEYWRKFVAAVTVASVTFFLPMAPKDAYGSTSYSGDIHPTTDYRGLRYARTAGNPEAPFRGCHFERSLDRKFVRSRRPASTSPCHFGATLPARRVQ